MSNRTVIFWFRRDLRLFDNRALEYATQLANGSPVVALFVIDDELLAPSGTTRANFLESTLRELDRSIGGALTVRAGDPVDVLAQVATEIGATDVVASYDFAPYGSRRDERVGRRLRDMAVAFTRLDSPYVVTPGTIVKSDGSPFRVFTAFRRAWEPSALEAPTEHVEGTTWRTLDSLNLAEVGHRSARRRPWYFGDLPDEPAPSPPAAGEIVAHQALEEFATKVGGYEQSRNALGDDATSRLSFYLRFGTLHPRQVLARTRGEGVGRSTFQSEICWREFYADVLWHHPESVRDALQPSLVGLEVDRDDRALERFNAWALGQTGYPLVDAGMRQLLREGWMHNRARMVTASFLVKHLHLDWRWGARWFMWRLVDGDLASNQHGWQWTAGTGTDAAPFHRIFNPTIQATRFDPEGTYVRRYVDELSGVPSPRCLQPGGGDGLFSPSTYPAPIVDANIERREALDRFARARASARVVS